MEGKMKKIRRPRTAETNFKSMERGEKERGRRYGDDCYNNFIGAKVTPSLDNYLNKLSIKYNISKGELIRTLVEDALIMEASRPIKTFYTLRKVRIEDDPDAFKE